MVFVLSTFWYPTWPKAEDLALHHFSSIILRLHPIGSMCCIQKDGIPWDTSYCYRLPLMLTVNISPYMWLWFKITNFSWLDTKHDQSCTFATCHGFLQRTHVMNTWHISLYYRWDPVIAHCFWLIPYVSLFSLFISQASRHPIFLLSFQFGLLFPSFPHDFVPSWSRLPGWGFGCCHITDLLARCPHGPEEEVRKGLRMSYCFNGFIWLI